MGSKIGELIVGMYIHYQAIAGLTLDHFGIRNKSSIMRGRRVQDALHVQQSILI
jgi:hypothetical protein